LDIVFRRTAEVKTKDIFSNNHLEENVLTGLVNVWLQREQAYSVSEWAENS